MLLPRRLQHYLLGSLLTLGSIAFGVAPQFEVSPRLLTWQSQAIAQSAPVSEQDVRNYARA